MINTHEGWGWVYENSMVKSSLVAKRWPKEVNDHPNWMMKHFKAKVANEDGCQVSKHQAYMAMWKALLKKNISKMMRKKTLRRFGVIG